MNDGGAFAEAGTSDPSDREKRMSEAISIRPGLIVKSKWRSTERTEAKKGLAKSCRKIR
jgi:hypothetical protein